MMIGHSASKVVFVACAMSLTIVEGTLSVIRHWLTPAPTTSSREKPDNLVENVERERNRNREEHEQENTLNISGDVGAERRRRRAHCGAGYEIHE